MKAQEQVAGTPPDPPAAPDGPAGCTLDFAHLYRAWFPSVCRWLRAMGIPDSDREDVAQEVFVVVERKLAGFDGQHLQAWLYRIATHTASDHRRRAWWKNLFVRRAESGAMDDRPGRASDPAELLDIKERRRQLFELLGRLTERRRTTLALFEIEGYSCDEIAALQGISPGTVRTRIHEARSQLFRMVARLPESSRRGVRK